MSIGVAFAAKPIPPTIPRPSTIPGPLTEEEQANNKSQENKGLVFTLLPRFATTSIGFVTIVSFLMLVIGGIRFITMYGNEEAVDKGKKTVIYAIVGLIIAMLAYAIVVIVSNLELNVPTNP